MHELGITQSLIEIALDHAQGQTVTRVILEIGQLTAISPEAIAFCFDACCPGTVLENAVLEILEIPGRGQCQACQTEIPLNNPFGLCACGGVHFKILQGQELRVKAIEIQD